MLARTDSRTRALFVMVVVALAAAGIGARLVWWQVLERDHLVTLALRQLASHEEVPAKRGEIRDASGTLLATSIEVQSIFATPPSVEDPQRAARQLAPILGVAEATLAERLASDDEWVWLKRRVDHDVAGRVRDLGLRGIGMLPETRRAYPMPGAAPDTTVAAQLLGFVNADGVGQYGLESALHARLAGEPGAVVADEDVIGRQIAGSVHVLSEPVDGADLHLTLDAGVQHLLESALWETYRKNYAKGATGIVMDVHTGAILAMASFPSYDANRYSETEASLFVSPAVSRLYEPGSVMKTFTVAAALEAGAITPRTTVVDDNNLRVRGIRIQNADRYWYPYGHGEITAAEVLALSNNVGAARIALLLGGERLYQAFLRYGFGAPTGIEVAGEEGGVVWDPESPNASGELTTAQNAFGQGITVTALQLAAGYAAVANGGTLVTPHVVAGWTPPGGEFEPVAVAPGERVMDERTARTVLRLLTGAIDEGIASNAGVPGYSIAGKTGTAQIAGPVTVGSGANAVTRYQYIDGWVDSSFVGIMPASEPRLVTLILIHRPAVWGRYQMVQRPESVFARLAPEVLDYLAIPPDREEPTVATR